MNILCIVVGFLIILFVNTNAKDFTLEELSKYNGIDGAKAYVAIDGIIYDVTNVPQWKGGMHMQGLTAGKDLSNYIDSAPHRKRVLNHLPKVGKLISNN